MKRILLLCLVGMAAHNMPAAPSNSPQAVQPFSGVVWTTTTLHSPSGKAFTFMRRTVYTRDAVGNVRREIYKATKGAQHDTTAPLEHVITGTTSAQTLPLVQSSKETLEQDADLGTLQMSGLPAKGRRQTFQDASGQRTHTLETWFSPTLGLTVRTESRNAHGDSVVSNLSELQLGEPAAPSAAAVPIAGPAIPLLVLYRGLFMHIAHVEQDRLANDPNLHVNMKEIEAHLRKKMSLSTSEWQLLVDKSVKVDSYTREMSKQARTFADQDRAARQQNSLSANTPAAGRATLHAMQLELNAHVQRDIEELETTVGLDGTKQIHAYLQGPMAASTSLQSTKTTQTQAQRDTKENAR